MKKLIRKEIIHKPFDKQPTWKDIKDTEFQDNDFIQICYDEEDDIWIFSIERLILETEQEYIERLERQNFMRENMKQRRHEQYLKLKEEFEK